MNYFQQAVNQVLKDHGSLGKYIRVSASVYDIETGSNTLTDTTYSVQMYEKHVKTSQFNYPHLIGKQVSMFYISADKISFVPSVKDVIEFNGTKFTIESFSEHVAKGKVIMYKILAIRS